MEKIFSLEKYAEIARQAAGEGIVLLKNDNNILPLKKGSKIAVFGRTQFEYYHCGTGSGGLVHTSYVAGILDSMKRCSDIELNEKVIAVYEEWLKKHPFDRGSGWAQEPWSQYEMVPEKQVIKEAAKESEVAIIVLGRTAGEDRDNAAQKGSYLLTNEEEQLLSSVCSIFEKTIVLLNVGNIIDMKWVEEFNPAAVLYVWQGGQEGGNAILDILLGKSSPCGKLTDTIAYDIIDYPSTENFGNADRNIYAEDIYVGYRYFETFAPEKVMYPFGFGLSYTTFVLTEPFFKLDQNHITASVTVTNTGTIAGKEVIQLYCEAPQGKLGKPSRILCGFAKTKELAPGEKEVVSIDCHEYYYASYDDSGCTEYPNAYLLEAGTYCFYIGNSVRNTILAGTVELEKAKLVEQLRQNLAPVIPFRRMRPGNDRQFVYEEVPLKRTVTQDADVKVEKRDIGYIGDQGWKLADVAAGKVKLDDFISQLSDNELCTMLRGEGMCSLKVTPGTAGAFGGITKALNDYGIPAGCCADGPSGIRMDCGTIAFSMPNGTCLACTFNEQLCEQLFEMTGMELRKNKIDTLLGPGINIHRSPLNGRNFEYFSEDPYLTGKIAAAQLKGMHKYQVTGTIKHFACNNQEYRRVDAEVVASERALREIYLKGFEIAVKEADAYSIMTMYGPINGYFAPSNYDLLVSILFGEWNYQGLVMTDWWAQGNVESEIGIKGSKQAFSSMVKCRNDLYMVTADPESNTNNDDLETALASGKLTRTELAECAMDVCRALMRMPAFLRIQGIETELDKKLAECLTEEDNLYREMETIYLDEEVEIPTAQINTDRGGKNLFWIKTGKLGQCIMTLKLRAKAKSNLAQLPLTVVRNNTICDMIVLNGEDVNWVTKRVNLGLGTQASFFLKLFFGQSGLEIGECKIRIEEAQ